MRNCFQPIEHPDPSIVPIRPRDREAMRPEGPPGVPSGGDGAYPVG